MLANSGQCLVYEVTPDGGCGYSVGKFGKALPLKQQAPAIPSGGIRILTPVMMCAFSTIPSS